MLLLSFLCLSTGCCLNLSVLHHRAVYQVVVFFIYTVIGCECGVNAAYCWEQVPSQQLASTWRICERDCVEYVWWGTNALSHSFFFLVAHLICWKHGDRDSFGNMRVFVRKCVCVCVHSCLWDVRKYSNSAVSLLTHMLVWPSGHVCVCVYLQWIRLSDALYQMLYTVFQSWLSGVCLVWSCGLLFTYVDSITLFPTLILPPKSSVPQTEFLSHTPPSCSLNLS